MYPHMQCVAIRLLEQREHPQPIIRRLLADGFGSNMHTIERVGEEEDPDPLLPFDEDEDCESEE